jgi:hypothetical protein
MDCKKHRWRFGERKWLAILISTNNKTALYLFYRAALLLMPYYLWCFSKCLAAKASSTFTLTLVIQRHVVAAADNDGAAGAGCSVYLLPTRCLIKVYSDGGLILAVTLLRAVDTVMFSASSFISASLVIFVLDGHHGAALAGERVPFRVSGISAPVDFN